jgi:hypothetical protein
MKLVSNQILGSLCIITLSEQMTAGFIQAVA